MSTPNASIALNALSNPPPRPLRTLYVARRKVPLPSVREGGSFASIMTGAPRTEQPNGQISGDTAAATFARRRAGPTLPRP